MGSVGVVKSISPTAITTTITPSTITHGLLSTSISFFLSFSLIIPIPFLY